MPHKDLKDPLRWRAMQEADLPTCLAFEARGGGVETTGRDAALQIWGRLLRQGQLEGVALESGSPASPRLVAAGARVFVLKDFADDAIANPRPGLTSRVTASVARGHPVLVPPDRVGHLNAGAGLDVVVVFSSWARTPHNSDLAEINALLAETFLEAHRGYRLNRIFREVVGRPDVSRVLESSGIFRVLARWPEDERVLAVVTREESSAIPYSIARLMFRYEEPTLRLSPSQRKLLAVALKGGTDVEIAATVRLSVPTVKKRWLSIFGKIAEMNPGVLGELADDHISRGKQKRHRVLAYIREHPEELRPFDYAGRT